MLKVDCINSIRKQRILTHQFRYYLFDKRVLMNITYIFKYSPWAEIYINKKIIDIRDPSSSYSELIIWNY